MAEEDAEIAMLHQMQAGQESDAWDNDNAEGAANGDIPSNTENSDQQVKEENFQDDQVLRALSPSFTGVPPDDDDYDPMFPNPVPAAVLTPARLDSRSSSRTSVRRPKTIGGFLADDSDDEDSVAPNVVSLTTSSVPLVTLNAVAGDSQGQPMPRSPLRVSTTVEEQNFTDRQNISVTPPVAADVASVEPVGQHAAQKVSIKESLPISSSAHIAMLASIPKPRLPHDRVGILEDRIREDPRGDLDAWLLLIGEHRKRNKLDDARAVYERFFKTFPSAADIWVAYAEMELGNDNFFAAEQIFGKSLLSVRNVQLWSVYLNYIRRRNDLTNDVTGAARATISQAYDFVLENIGIDKDSGKIWMEYVQFIRSTPGQIGGSTWQDQQKMDQLRKAYQRAICVPMSNVNLLWKEYDQFEMSLNKITGRKFLQERSPAYMTARSANTAMENVTRGLNRTNLPRLPPALGFEGDQEYLQQVELWRRWISWEKDDPLVLKDEDLKAYNERILYVYKQAVMALRFWPEIWMEAAEWCYANSMEKGGVELGTEFLTQGIAANPESCLLAYKYADRLETVLPAEEGDEGVANRGAAVREPYDRLLDALYDLIKELKFRETREIARIEESASLDAAISSVIEKAEEDDDEVDQIDKKAKEAAKKQQLKAVQQGFAMQTHLLARTISFSWIALMRAMRRIQGKGTGKPGALVGGLRQVLSDARSRGRITSDVYVASALIEHKVYKDPAGTKIFERGAKLFPEDEIFLREYIKHLLSLGDTTNARAVFETSVNRLAQKPELAAKAKPLYVFFHKYESEYGELSQIRKLEQRMADLFPEDPKLLRFAARYTSEGFDPTAVRPIISPLTQMRPKVIMQSIEQPLSAPNSPRPQYRQENSPRPQQRQEVSPRPTYLNTTNSPKRPLGDESGNESDRPRKLIRGESPLKGAAGRRLDQQKRMQQTHGAPTWQLNAPAPFAIPRDITFLLSIIPRADTYTATRFNPEAMVRLMAQTTIPEYGAWKSKRDQTWRR